MDQHQRYIATGIAGVIVAAVGGVAGVISLLDAIGVLHGSGSTTRSAVLAVICLCVAAAGAVIAIGAEHRLHHIPGGRSAWADQQGWRTSGSSWNPGDRRSLHAPASFGLSVLVLLGVTAFSLVGTIQAHSDAERSAYTQSHGVRETAVAENVQNIASTSRHGYTTYTSQIIVTVRHPAIGDGTATVYGQGQTFVQQGGTLTVLLDPKQPGYAEIPGSPYDTTASWIKGVLITIVFGIITVFVSRKAVIMLLRHRRVSLPRLRNKVPTRL
jgi:hypothetical protein